MRSVQDTLSVLRADPSRKGQGNPFRLLSTTSSGIGADAVASVFDARAVPRQLMELWQSTRSARLFVDQDYGQWGLELFSPEAALDRTRLEVEARPADFRTDDLVIGAFLGDQELLVIEGATNAVLVARPLDPRSEWPRVAETFAEFFARYVDEGGAKYWE